MRPARLLIDTQPQRGSWNMAVDQALLDSANEQGLITLRFYFWQPTLSLGYFQNREERRLHPPSLDCPVVRRSTGGGAILHDQEITYSLVIPSENRWSQRHESLYWAVHECIVRLLAGFEFTASLFGRESEDSVGNLDEKRDRDTLKSDLPEASVASRSFLCFQRRTPGDIVASGYKICGSAQRRKKNALLQHGSLLMRQSQFAPELPGILDLGIDNRAVGAAYFVDDWSQLLSEMLELDLMKSELADAELEQADQHEEVFLSDVWLNKKR